MSRYKIDVSLRPRIDREYGWYPELHYYPDPPDPGPFSYSAMGYDDSGQAINQLAKDLSSFVPGTDSLIAAGQRFTDVGPAIAHLRQVYAHSPGSHCLVQGCACPGLAGTPMQPCTNCRHRYGYHLT